ncbi:hypothetical protein Y032_0270g872 [Ancylostoma ceylanicum]|uniref:Saposin B-type domain-containing protein n=1 Tax=Ancylostoma ceylanicum TaxID=53326 RepID=A0A016S991_9BILA|nr:hypothetical protein Y032_0270g872 [Ancylostoma ceylanicum]
MFSISASLILSLLVADVGSSTFRKTCRTALQRGRHVIESTVPALVQEETTRFRRKVAERMKEMMNAEVLSPESLTFTTYVAKYMSDDGPATTLPPCPEPNRTMFTTLAPSTVITTTTVTSCSSTAASTTAGTTGTGTTGAAQTATSTVGTTGTGTTGSVQTTASQGTTGTAQSTSKSVTTTIPAQTTTVPMQADRVAVEDDTTQVTASGGASTAASSSSAAGSSAASSSQSTNAPTVPSTTGTSAQVPVCGAQETVKGSKRSFVMPTLYSSAPESDPFHSWMSSIYEYMFKEEEICDQPPFKDLNSITEDQLYGFLATLSAAHPGPFCSLCDRFMNEVRERVFVVNPLWGEDAQHIMRLLYANIPTAKTFCSAVAPACYENYAARTRNITEATICLECTACMTAGNIIQHAFLLDKGVVAAFLRFLRSSLFHNTCAELCLVWQPMNLTLFPNGFTYEGCMDFLTDGYQEVIDVATVILRPERFCSLELQWCELNEMPNIMHCLYELCIESLKDTPQTAWLCSLIPDTPVMANQFLNIQQTKRTKSRKPYHDKFLNEIRHDEL